MRSLKNIIRLFVAVLGVGLAATLPAKAQDAAAGDPALQAAIAQVLPETVNPEHVHILKTDWNGTPVVFADYPFYRVPDGQVLTQAEAAALPDAEFDLVVKAFVKSGDTYRALDIETLGPDGGEPEISAIAFANADTDKAKELIVLLDWPQALHYDYGGDFYEVHVFDDLDAGAKPLTDVNKHFGLGCECSWRDGRKETYRFKTVAEIEKELTRMGY